MVKKVWDDPKYLERKARKAERREIARGRYGPTYGGYGQQQLPAVRNGQQLSARQVQALPAGSPHGYQQGYPGQGYQVPVPMPMPQQPTTQLPMLGMQNGAVRPPALHAAGPAGQPAGGLVPLDPYGLRTPYQGPQGLFEHAVAGIGWTCRKAWHERWNLAPAAGVLGITVGAAVDPVNTLLAAGVTGAGARLWQWKGPEQIAGRTWLSRRERGLLWQWAAGATTWTAGSAVGVWDPFSWWGAITIGVMTGVQSWAWWDSRRVRPLKTEEENPAEDEKPELSETTMSLFHAWPNTIGLTEDEAKARGVQTTGPKSLQGSYILPDSITEQLNDEGAPTTIGFLIELDAAVHSSDAVGGDNRKHLERALRMGVGTVELEPVRDDAGQVRVILTPGRNLEKVDAVWDGPVLLEDGSIPVAVTSDGRDAHAGLENASGVEHGMIVGTSNVGKSFTLTNMVMPGVMAKREILIYVDGGNGSSAAHLAGACDWYAVEGPEEWGKAIMAAHSITRSRKTRRAQRGISKWRGWKNEDIPIVTLVIDEATTVKDEIGKTHEGRVLEILREGRKHGVRVIQISQDPMGDDIMGGRKARGLMRGAGTMIGHRVGDGVANTLAASKSQSIDLIGLPPGPGWCGIIRQGQVVAQRARVRHAKEEKVLELLTDFEPLALTGEDLIAAGGTYVSRRRGIHAAAEMRGEEITDIDVNSAVADDLLSLTSPRDPGVRPTLEEAAAELTAAGLVVGADSAPMPGSSEAAVVSLQSANAKLSRQAQKWTETGEANRGQILAILLANPAGLTKEGVIHQLPADNQLSDRTVRRALKKLEDTGRATQTPAGLWQATTTEKEAS